MLCPTASFSISIGQSQHGFLWFFFQGWSSFGCYWWLQLVFRGRNVQLYFSKSCNLQSVRDFFLLHFMVLQQLWSDNRQPFQSLQFLNYHGFKHSKMTQCWPQHTEGLRDLCGRSRFLQPTWIKTYSDFSAVIKQLVIVTLAWLLCLEERYRQNCLKYPMKRYVHMPIFWEGKACNKTIHWPMQANHNSILQSGIHVSCKEQSS